MKIPIKIATRTSLLAKNQARIVRDFIIKFRNNLSESDFLFVPLHTSGDWTPVQKEQTFLDMGATKGLFVKEIEDSLLSGETDIAVHSMKDVPVETAAGLEFAAMLPRGDPRDALVTAPAIIAKTLDDLPAGCLVGTSSLRRRAQVLARRPDLRVAPFRGNVDTRLKKLEGGAVDATLLAVAGLERLDRFGEASAVLDPGTMLPAPGQGALGVQIRSGDEDLLALFADLNDQNTSSCVGAERAALKILDGSCRAPVAALAVRNGDHLTIEALAAKPDGTLMVRVVREGPATDAVRIGEDLGHEIKGRLPCGFFLD